MLTLLIHTETKEHAAPGGVFLLEGAHPWGVREVEMHLCLHDLSESPLVDEVLECSEITVKPSI